MCIRDRLVLEEPAVVSGGERFVDAAHLVAERARQQADDRVAHHHGGQLAAGEHVVADREALVCEVVGALVHPLVTSADEQDPTRAGEALRHALRERLAAWREEHNAGALVTPQGDIGYGAVQGLDFHEHAGTAAERGIIYLSLIHI